MSIYDWVYLLTDDSIDVAVWDFTTCEEVFCGSAADASFEFGDYELDSVDITPPDSRGVTVILNITIEEGD